jgi:myo-inositol 2-dehydrogenase / D-chiro-inositol 1-dehydrogenase
MKKLRLALFGLGRAGRFHLQSLRSASGLELRHVVDTDEALARRVGEENGCAWGTDRAVVLADADVDAVIVATPTQTHHDYIIDSLNAGKAVFTEKPLGTGMEEIDACYGKAKEQGLLLFLGFMRRFDPSFADLAQRVHEGEIGTLQLLRTTSRDCPLPTIDYIKTSHGIFHDCIVHDLDMVRFIAREDPCEVFSYGSSFIPEIGAVGDIDTVLVTLKFPSGLLCSIDISRHAVYGYDQRIEVFGDGGMIQAENRSALTTRASVVGGGKCSPIEFSFPTRYRDAYLRELEAFRDCLLEKKPLPINHEDARMNFILADAAERSFRTGAPVAIER